MDFRDLLHQHIEKKRRHHPRHHPGRRAAASDFGIMHTDPDRRIIRFEEKPKEPARAGRICTFPPQRCSGTWQGSTRSSTRRRWAFTFSTARRWSRRSTTTLSISASTSSRAIENTRAIVHFSGILGGHRDHPRLFRREPCPDDAGASFSVSLTRPTRSTLTPGFFPASKFNGATIKQAIISDGCVISDATSSGASSAFVRSSSSGTTIRNASLWARTFTTRTLRAAA